MKISLENIQKKQQEMEERKAAQETVPVLIDRPVPEQNGGLSMDNIMRNVQAMRAPKIKATQYNYDTLAKRTVGYGNQAYNNMDKLLPSDNWFERLQKIYSNAGVLKQEASAVSDFARETGQQTTTPRSVNYALNRMQYNAQKAAETLGKYENDTDYLLGEKTKSYEDFNARMEETQGDAEARKKVVGYGLQNREDITATAQEAAASATDQQLQEFLKSARTPEEKQVFQAEIDKRRPQRQQTAQDKQAALFAMLTEDQSRAMYNDAARRMVMPTGEDAKRILEDEISQINESLQSPALPEHDRNLLEARKLEATNALREYAGEVMGPDSPQVNAYKEAQAEGVDLPYTERYTRQNAQEAQDWQAVGQGEYTGNDQEKKDLQQAYDDAVDEAFLAYYAAMNGEDFLTGEKLTEEQQAEAQQRYTERKAHEKAVENQIKENAQAAAEKANAAREALYGKPSVLRWVGAEAKKIATTIVADVDSVLYNVIGKPLEMIYRIGEHGVNAVLGKNGDQTLGDTITDTYSNGFSQKMTEHVFEISDAAAAEELAARLASSDSTVLEVGESLIFNFGRMLPTIALNTLTSGGTLAADGLVNLYNGALQSLTQLDNVRVAGSGVSKLMQLGELMKTPGYATSFMMEWGNSLKELQELGVKPGWKEALATLTAAQNAFLEIGPGGDSGVNALGKVTDDAGKLAEIYTKQTGKQPGVVLKWLSKVLDSAPGEGIEEFTQGLTGSAFQKIGFDIKEQTKKPEDVPEGFEALNEKHTYPWFSMTPGDKAVFNVPDLAKEAGIGALSGAFMTGTLDPVMNIAAQRRADVTTGRTVMENDWGQQLAQAAQNAGIENETTRALSEQGLDATRRKGQRQVGKLFREVYDKADTETEAGREALETASAMLTHNRGQLATDNQKEAIETGKELAGTLQVSEDGKLHVNRIGQQINEQAAEEATQDTRLIGVQVQDGKPMVKVRQGEGETELVPFEDVQFPDAETAEKAAISAMVGNEELSNAMFNAKAPGGDISFAEFARQFGNAYEAAKKGVREAAIKASGIADGLQDVELHAAFTLGEARQYVQDRVDEVRRKAQGYIAGKLRGKVEDGDVNAVSDALLKQEAGEELTQEEADLLDKYKSNENVQGAIQDMQEDDIFIEDLEDEPAPGSNEAYQYGLSGRSLEELERTLQGRGEALTEEIRAQYDRGAADLAYKETQRIEQVKKLNRGADGTRVGVLRGISDQEAANYGVGKVSAAYTNKARAAITALRGLAEDTGVNMVLFESPVKEGVHQGANGWYDRDTQTVYLDVYSGKDNEQAIMRTAAHELTHFIQDWSPAMFNKYRKFLLDFYYSSDNDTVKRLLQEQYDKDATLTTDAEAMDEVIADASEMMISGDEDATRALAEQHPKLFVRVRGWIDTWAKAVTRAWHAITGTSNEASRLLKATAEKFNEAQRMWWTMLEDASVNLRGEIRTAEIEADKQAKIQQMRSTNARQKEAYEKRRQAAIDRANAAKTAAEAEQAVRDAQAAEAAKKALETKQRQEAAEINKEAQQKQKEADKITRIGKQIQKKIDRLSGEAQDYVRRWAEEHGVALDGTMQTGSALSKKAAHYFNQGKAGIEFTPNTDDTDADDEFARHMNRLGMKINEEAALQAVADEEPQAETAEQPAPDEQPAVEPETEEQPETAPETEKQPEVEPETEEQPEAVEPEQTLEEVAEEVVRNGFDDKRLLNMDAINNMPVEDLETLAGIFNGQTDTTEETEEPEEAPAAAAPEITEEETAEEQPASTGGMFIPGEKNNLPFDVVIETIRATPEETQAAEQHAATVEKMDDVLKGLPKKARTLVMKWAANEWVNVNLEDGSPAGIRFAKFAAKWYNAGKEGTSVIHVPITDGDMGYPPFLQDTFYKQGKADAEAAEKRKKAREGKKNEKPADKGTGEGAGQPGLGTERVLEKVPAEVLQGESGGGDAVPEPEGEERLDGGNDAGSDGSGSVRERGEGVRERDHVRPETGEVTDETDQTPEEQLAETVEETEEQLEAETPKGTNYRIGDTLDLPNGEKARYKANVEAIRLLKRLEAEGRYATADEQNILSKYVGWGGIAQAFDENNPKWAKEYAELVELLTRDEYNAARASTVNAHYTSIEVIRAMYDGLRHLGFQGGRMLEPSGGIGHFIGAMPADMQQKVRGWTMVELDSITGRIAEKLYPNADVRVEGFENAKIGNNIIDVAIGNVPFGNFPIVDDTYPRTVTSAIHNYFFAKAIDKVRPGGLLMFITSHYTMDAQSSSVREYMMQKADLLGAVRLPNTAFKGNAGTEVVTDILVFKKREAGTPYKGQNMQRIMYQEMPGGYSYVNQYFVEHPEMVLGETAMTGTMYRGGELTVNPRPGNLGDQIREAMGKIEGSMDYTNMPTVEELQKRAEKARKNTKENGFEIKNGKLYQNKNGELQAVEMKEADAQKVKDMLAIRDTARQLQEMQKQGAPEEAIKEMRKRLNLFYDTFVAHNGVLHDRRNAKLIEADPDHFFIMALEDYDKKKKTATKAAIFDRNTIAKVVTVTHADTPQDAVAVVLNEKGYIDLARAAELLGVSTEDAQASMLNTGLAFLKQDGTLDTRENYLSGNVRAKLREAEALATVDDRYQRNVDELRKVIPEDIGRESIYVKPGATWIPDVVYEQFICETLKEWNGYRRNVTVKYVPSSGDYTLELSSQAKRDYRNTQEWGTPDKTFAEILEALMNNKQISVYRKTMDGKSMLDEAASLAAREKAEKIQKWFTEWLWQNEERAKKLEALYNDKYNAIVTPDYDGSSLTIAGANADKQLRPHQKNVVHRIVQGGGNTLIAHCVGAGKTAEMAGAAMKLRQLGIVQKPVFVVPKALVGQWGREFLDFFPAAKILVLSESDFNAKNRKEFANRIATGDYDAVIMSREQYSHIPMTPEYEKRFYEDTIQQIVAAIEDEKRASGKQGLSVKNMEKTKKRLEAKLKKLETKARDADNIYFEDMGIDSIFVDEAHEYKNLMFTTNMNNVSGLGNKEGSQRAFDMYMKTRYLRQLNGGRGIVFATATPVMNSMSEMYIMQKYLQEDTLNQLGIQSFDAWANLFGEVMTVIEPTPSGKGFRQKQAFARFKNLPELQRLFRSFADVKTKVEGLKIPKMKTGKRITIECEPGQFQLDYIDQLAERAERMKNGHVDPKEDNMLKITSEGRKLSYTQRMIDPSLPYEDGSKIVRCVEEVERIWKESKKNKGTQLIFCDMATPKGSSTVDTDAQTDTAEDAENVDFYGDIKRMLVARGVPANEIAFIHDADTNEKKNKLFEDVNNGVVRVLIGSTGKMGVGMNAQKRIVALHHLDAPWRPGDIEQREGRALRQGNINEEVGIYVYVTKKTFDTRMWDNLYRKSSFINQIMNGTNTAREVEGDGDFALSAAEIKAIATGDPMIVEQFEVANKIKQLENLEREHNREKKLARNDMRTNETYIAAYKERMPLVEKDQKAAAAVMDKDFRMKVEGKTYDARAKAAGPLLDAIKRRQNIPGEEKIAEVGSFAILTNGRGELTIKGAAPYSVNANLDSDDGTMTRVLNKIKNLQENLDNLKASIKQMEEANRSLQAKIDAPFERAAELEQLRARAEEIANILNPVEDQAGANAADGSEETEDQQPTKNGAALEADMKESNGPETHYGDHVKFSMRVTDQQELDFLEKQKKIKTYKTMQLIDGHLYPPMAAVVAGSKEDYSVLGQWEKATEHPELIKEGNKFTLNKGKGQGSLAAAYNPYMHSSNLMINDQFSGAYARPNLVTVECEVPTSEATSNYHAEYAKDSTGWHSWHTGVVAGALRRAKGLERKVFLSRWIKPARIVPDTEVAQHYADLLSGTDVVIPDNVVYPSLLEELKKLDVPIKESGRVKSERNPDDLSNRQLLARAFEGIAQTDKERESLEKYKSMVEQLDTDTEKLKQLRKQIHDKTFVKGQVDRPGAAKLREEANALERKITKADKTLLRMERSAALKNVLEVEKREAQRKVTEKIRGQIQRYNEGVEKREYEQRIKKTTERLAKWIVQPDKTNHVPKALRSSVAKFLLSIQQGTRTEFRGQGGEKRERNFIQNMRELQGIVRDINAYQMLGADERVEADFGMYVDLPDGFADQMADLIRSVESTMEKAGTGFSVDYMTAEQLKTLSQVLNTISASITQANDMLALNSFRHVSQAAQNSIKFIRDQGKVEYLTGGQLHNFLNWENMQPIRAFARFGEGGEAVFKSLMRGQAQMARNVRDVIKLTEKVYTAKEARAWSEEIRTYNVGGKVVSMPVADVMSMYCLMKRAQAVGHILGEGFRVADFKQGRKTIAGSGVTVTEEEARKIVDSLTPRQKAVADELQRIMSTTGSRWGNYVSMKRFGYEMFTEKNYFPIEVDSDRLTAKTDESKGNELYRLLNLSSVKPITRGANNRLMLKNIFDVYASHMSDMAQYNAMGLPVLDAVKWINYRESVTKSDGTIATEGVRSAAREMYGNKSQRYIIELLKDINGTQATGDMGEQWSRKMLMRFNRQAVAANLSVAAKQPTSIIRAATELGGFDLIRGAMGNQGMLNQNRAEMLEYSGIAIWKDLGFYDVNVSRPVKQMIMHTDTAVDRLLKMATWMPEKADEITWAAMWGACKAWVHRQGGTYATTDEFMQAVADKFEDVIYKTQVVDSILTRSQFMRGTSFMNKTFSSFMSEPTTTYNMLLEAWFRFRNDLRKGLNMGQAFMKNRSIITKTAAVYFVSAAVMTILNALIGAMRDDDDYETFMEKFQAGLLDNAADEVLPFNLLPIVSDVYDYAKKFLGEYVLPEEWGISSYAGGSSAIYSAMDTALSAVEVAEKYFSGEGRYTWYAVTYKTANALSQASGVPVAPAMRDVVSIWNTFIVPFAPDMRIETYESTEANGAKALYKAITTGDKEREKTVMEQLEANDYDEKKLFTAIKKLIQTDRETGKINEAQAIKYLQDMADMEADDAYFKVQEWGYEGEEDYSRFLNLKNALIADSGVAAAKKELTSHGYKEKEVQSKITSLIAQAAAAGEITDTKATALLKKYSGMDADDAYWKLKGAHYNATKDEDAESFSKYDKLEQAVLTGKGYDAAVKELLDHGLEKADVQSKVRSIITEQSVKNGMSDAKVMDLLQRYGGMKADEAWVRTQELQYQKLTNKSTSADTAMVIYAVDNKQSPKKAIDDLLAHGKTKSGIASSITSHYKEDYLKLLADGKISEAAALKGRLASIFDYLGYNGVKKIADWEKPKKTK